MKPLVIYHDNCADGFGAAFAAWLKFGDEAEYVPFKYGQPLSEYFSGWFLPERDIYILDFSFSKEVMDQLFKLAKKVVWLDHHKTAFERWCETEREWYETDDGSIILDNSRSGALIAWEYFHPGKEVPMLIKHIDDYDRWQFKLEGTKEFNKALWSYAPWSFDQWRNILLDTQVKEWIAASADPQKSKAYQDFILEGAAILRAHDQNVQAVVKGAARKCVITILKNDNTIWDNLNWPVLFIGLAANCPPHLASDVGHQLANQSGTYGLLWAINKEGKCLCSLRSNGDYDVSAIAKVFGGGGHRNAAGFEVDINKLLDWIK